jgi:protein-S-isoprenylcysteine O-methyltransferase Ste14
MNEQVYAAPEFAEPRPLQRWLLNPWADKIFAILALLPFIYPVTMHFKKYFNLGELTFVSELLLLIGTMIFRRKAVRISVNPYYWMLSLVATYWGLLILSVEQHGHRLVSPSIIAPIYACSIFIVFWGRISLGRNIGVLPAQREIVDRGAYRWMRHPIYSAYFLSMIAGALQSYSPFNLSLYSLGIFWFVFRTLAEEDFLIQDSTYAAYVKRVPWRWVPGIL